MHSTLSKRFLIVTTVIAIALVVIPTVNAQAKTKLRFSCAFAEQDPRADAYKAFAEMVKDDFDFEPYWLNTLYKQSTELVAMQRGNVELVNLAPADIAKQLPAWSLMTSAYLFRDVDHLWKVLRSDVGKEFIKMAHDQLGIQVIVPTYYGSRCVNLKTEKKITTPADLSGMKVRMPPGEFWQFLGESIGAVPTPVAFAETYTALQTGAVDGQDNPPLNTQLMKFDEVTNQYILTRHVIGYDLMTVSAKIWDAMTPEQQAKFQAAAEKAWLDYQDKFTARENAALESFKSKGLKVYTPDVEAFRKYAQKKYSDKYGKDWPKGALESINGIQ